MTEFNKIEWCCMKKDGIRLVERNERVGNEYLKSASLDLLEMKTSSLKWKNIQAYYSCYNSFYAILVKAGIKCEIHECSLALLDFFGFSNQEKDLVNNLKKLRTNVQYYLQKPEAIDEKAVAGFVLKCQHIFNLISNDEIENIRNKFQKIIDKSAKKKFKTKKGEKILNSRGGGDGGRGGKSFS